MTEGIVHVSVSPVCADGDRVCIMLTPSSLP